MTTFLLGVTILVGLLIILGLHRIGRGPTVFDRFVAAALVAANGMVLLLLTSFLFGRTDMFVDIVIAYALLAFVLPIALGKYYEQERDE